MKNTSLIYILAIVGCFFISCRDDFKFEMSKGNELTFSKDTVYLDTIFSNIGSSTYNLKVYNKTSRDIKIPSIKLAKGNNSNFRIMVDGISGKNFENIELLSNDSLFIFIETTVDIKNQTNEKEFLYTDELLFQSGSQQQKVNLVTLIKDAVFLYPQRYQNGNYESITINDEKIYGFFLDENDNVNGNELQWTNNKPYVIYGYAAVPNNKTLTIEEGAEIHFHRNSALVSYPTSKIIAQGSIAKPIVFQGDRLEPSFEDTPGQWQGIIVGQNSELNMRNALVKNAVNGLFINSNTIQNQLHNVQVYNCENYGLLLANANVKGSNLVTNNCGRAALKIGDGGTYDFIHCTFANYWSRQNHTAVNIDNGDGSTSKSLNANFKNSIIFGNSNESLLLSPANDKINFNYSFQNCLIKFYNTGNRYDTNKFPYLITDNNYFNNCFINKNTIDYLPYFLNTSKNKLMITDKATQIIAKGNTQIAQQFPQDLLGKNRSANPDLGAYQHVSSSED